MAKLKKQKKLILKKEDATIIMEWLRLKPKGEATDEDRAYAQAILIQMMDATFAEGVDAASNNAAKMPKPAMKVIKTFLKKAGKNLVVCKSKPDMKLMIKKPAVSKASFMPMLKIAKKTWR